ncbi:MAG: protein kinase [Myxococcales bacterium]|nr:protein kinase [Myxococcales bacterium]
MLLASLVSGNVMTLGEPSLQAACESRIGRVLNGKWTLEKLLGVGGMAAVYVAHHKIGRREAIKILHPEIARSKELRARFEQEAQAVNRFAHPGAVEIRDIDASEDGCPFLVMELLEGENLAERAGRFGGLPREEMLGHVDSLLDVLAAAHAQGIVHRDIKLDNLFVTTDGKLKVLDFGIARITSGPALTKHGARLGTTAYMAPEQVRGEEVDARTDVFAVGATMFRLLAKRRIHEAASEAELLVKMGRDPAPPIASVAPDVDRGLALVVDRALAFDREQRYPNALTMQGDVRALITGELPPFALAREQVADKATVFGDQLSAPRGPALDLAAATDPTRAEPAIPGPAIAPQSVRPRVGGTVALRTPTPPPGSLMTPVASVAAGFAPAPTSMAAPPSSMATPHPPSAWTPPPSQLGGPPVSGPVSSAYVSAAPVTPQGFATPAPILPKKTGGMGVVIGIAAIVGLGALVVGAFYMTSSSSSSGAAVAEADERDDEPVKRKKKTEEPKPAATTEAAPPAATPPAAPTEEPEKNREEKADKEAKEDREEPAPPSPLPSEPAPAKPAATSKSGSPTRPATPGSAFEPAPIGKPKRPTPGRPTK